MTSLPARRTAALLALALTVAAAACQRPDGQEPGPGETGNKPGEQTRPGQMIDSATRIDSMTRAPGDSAAPGSTP